MRARRRADSAASSPPRVRPDRRAVASPPSLAICSAVVGALAAFYPEYTDPDDTEAEGAIFRLLAKLPTIAAYSYKHSIGQPFIYPRNDLDYTSNFMHMMFSTPCEEYVVDETVADALNILFILHAEHEQNCSTSTVRLLVIGARSGSETSMSFDVCRGARAIASTARRSLRSAATTTTVAPIPAPPTTTREASTGKYLVT